MKNNKIFINDWLQLHPYHQSNETDMYYTRIANQVLGIMEKTKLSQPFEESDAKQMALRITAYFEDMISGLNIWRTFTAQHLALYGKRLPFYTPNDHYYDDEVNYEDIRFLLWHYTQQYYGMKKGVVVSPDNAANGDAATGIYQLFCDEWSTAPENERMKSCFTAETRYEQPEDYDQLLFWFHYNSYLFTNTKEELTNAVKAYWEQHQGNGDQYIIYFHDQLAHCHPEWMLAYTSPQWLALVMPEDHPDYELFAMARDNSLQMQTETIEGEEQRLKTYENFEKIADGKLLLYFEDKKAVQTFAAEKDLDLKDLPLDAINGPCALYATKEDGLQLMIDGIAYIKDESNPFYDAEAAHTQTLSFFVVGHCTVPMLKKLEESGFLADAHIKSLLSKERSHEIVHENWKFLTNYFLQQSVK